MKLSASSLSRWFSCGCPAQWNYSRQWKPESIEDENLKRGILVHALLDGTHKVTKDTDPVALKLAEKIRKGMQMIRLNVFPSTFETTQKFLLHDLKVPGYPHLTVEITRRIDAIGLDSRGFCVVDYKATKLGWKVEQARGIQATLYTLNNGSRLSDYGIGSDQGWPQRILFVVAGLKGRLPQILEYQFDQTDYENLLSLIKTAILQIKIAEEQGWPKHYGYPCTRCSYTNLCLNNSEEGLVPIVHEHPDYTE